MSTFSSDRIANIIVPDLQKRFRRGYIDYFNRKDKTYRPVEEVQIRSIVPLEQFEELMKLLDDIVLFSAATPELATKFQGLWNRLDLPDKDDKDRIECTRMGLISLESYIKVFIYLLCGNGDLLRQIEAEKHGLGYILNELGVPSPDGKRGLFDSRYKGLFDTLRRYRNGITHSPSDTDTEESDILMPRGNLNDAYDGLFLLTLTGLLLLLHHHAGYYRRYLDEHRPELPPEKAAAASPADDFDLERFKDRYLEELLGEQNRELKQKVGFIGRIDNQQTLNLLPLKLQRRQDAGEGLSDPDYGGRPHESGDFTDGEQGGMAMDDLIDAGDRISLILGNPGAGKTTVLIRLIRQYADLWHNGDRSILPLRINLNAVTEGQTMDDALRTAFNAGFGITTTEDRKRMVFAHAEQLLAEGRIALFIDGLNELKVSRPELFIASLGSFIAKYDKCRFHITGRIHEFAACREAFRRIEGCGVYHLCEISLDQILLYLRQLGLPEERIDEFRLQIIRAGIEELLGTPLNFMMIAALLLGSTEYKIPAVGNRGELLEMFMRSSLSVRSREKLVDEAVNFNAFDLLQQMAWRIAAEGQRVLREDFVIEIARDPRYKGADRVEKLVDSLIGLHIVEQSVDHKGSWLTFFVDTYLEYFFARRLALDFCERHAPLPGQLDVTNERNFEILKLTLELICSGWVRKEGCIADGRDFVKALYDLGRNPAQPAATTTADGVLQTEGLPSKPAVNGNLVLVARMASGLKPYTDKTNPNARLLIESWLLNTMVVYRIGHPVPDTEGDYDYIRQLAECAVVLSSERIFRELFSDYWLTTLLLTVADDFGMQLPENSVKASALHRALIDNCTDVRLFYRFLHSRYLDLVLFRPRSALRIRKFLSLLFGNLKKYTQKLLYGYIAEWREADAQRQGGDHYLAQDANTLLLCIDDVDYLISRYDLPAAERSRTKIGWSQLRKLVRNYDDERLAAFIFTERFFALLQNREQMALYLFRYYIFRNHFPRCLMQFLFEGTGRKGISPGNLSELLDAFPLEKIPVGEARKRYDNEIYDYLTQETHSEESDDGLIYRIFDVNAERIRLAIKDANTPFEGLTACIRTDDTRMFCRVEADGYVDARGETFSLSSRDGSLLPVSGKIVAPDGTELAYAASASNKEISVTCYDKAEIAWLHALAEAGTGVRIGSAECSLRPSPLHGRNHLLPRRRPVRTGRHRPTYAPGEPLPQPPAVPADHPGSAQSPGDPLHPLRVRRPQGLGDHRQADERRPLPRRIRPPVDQKPVGHLPVRRGMQDAAGLRGTHPALVRQMGPETVGNAPPYAPRRFDRAYPLYLLPLEPHHVRPAHIPRGFRGPDSRPVGLRPLHRREGRFPGRETQPAPRIGGVLRAEFQTVASGAGACRRAVRRSGQRFARHHAEARNAARAALVHRRIARPFHHAGQRLLCGNRLAGPRSPLSRARLGHAARQRALPARPRLDGAPVHPADAAAGAVVRRT